MKLLIIAYDFPPFFSIGGLRPHSWYKYLPDFGAEVTVVTRDWQPTGGENNYGQTTPGGVTIELDGKRKLIRVPFKKGFKESVSARLSAPGLTIIRKAITFSYNFLEYLSLRFDSKAALYDEADKLLQTDKFDFIIATGKPFILFRYAALLSKAHSTPWIADYRDSWTLNHLQSDYSLTGLTLLLNNFYKAIEKKYVSTARIITTVAPTYLAFMPPFVKQDNIRIVYNGYDNDVEQEVEQILPAADKFVISYAGHIYPMQKLETFLEGTRLFIQQSKVSRHEFEIHFWGLEADPTAIARILNYDDDLNKVVHFHNKTGYFEVMKQISVSHILLLIASNSDSWLNAKLFDYLALKRPILMVGNETNIMNDILKETNGGKALQTPDAVAAFILDKFRVYRERKINNTINYQQYSRKNQAEKFYSALKDLT